MNFEWAENKRRANLDKHGLDLIEGIRLFDGRPIHSYPSPHGEENRTVTIGFLDDVCMAVVWTERETGIRLISLRRARDVEKRKHRELYG